MLFTQLCVLACSRCLVVSSSLLYIATVCLVLPCWNRVSGGSEGFNCLQLLVLFFLQSFVVQHLFIQLTQVTRRWNGTGWKLRVALFID